MSGARRERSISIIIPVRNEASLLRDFLHQLRDRAPGAEIIVVDGESSDGSDGIARDVADRVLRVPPSRASQLNAGARVASGETFWFLHADTKIPSNAIEQIECVLRNPAVAAGFFRIQLPHNPIVYRLTDSFAHYAGKILRIRCGDHGLFCRRSVFEAIGGFPDVPLMEDVEFFRALHRYGVVVSGKTRLTANPRRYEQVGPWRLTLAYGLIASLYLIGVPLNRLRAIYEHTCSGRRGY